MAFAPADGAEASRAADGGLGGTERAGFELAFAHMETRLRTVITELVQPTVQRTSLLVTEVDNLKGLVQQHARGLQDVQLSQFKAIEQVNTISSFKEELAKWDQQRQEHESSVNEKTEAVQQRMEGFRYSLEQKQSALHHLQRSVDRVAAELNRLIEEQESQRDALDGRLDDQSKRLVQLQAELEVRLAGIEQRHNALSDELWGEEMGLAKVAGQLTKTNSRFNKLEEEVATLQAGKAEAAQLDKLRAEVGKMLHEASTSVNSMRHTVGEVVNDVREHFRTASETIAAHNATFVKEVREQYQEELANAAKLRNEVQGFMEQMDESVASLDVRVTESVSKSEALAAEAREELEELNRRRKRDKTSADNELKALKRRLGGVFDSSDAVLQGLEHLYAVMRSLLQSELIQCSMEQQDSADRQTIALMGVKDDETVLARTTHTEPQRPRPECRARTAPGGAKPQGVLRGGPGTLSARGAPQEPVVRVDNRCISCSGQAPLVLAAFKMACLHYTPSPVVHEGKQQDRKDLLGERQRLLQGAYDALVEGPKAAGGGVAAALLRAATGTSTCSAAALKDFDFQAEDDGGDALGKYAATEARIARQCTADGGARVRLPNLPAGAGVPSPRVVVAR